MNRTASKITDMTEGNPVRIILAFALPLFIGNIFQQIYSLADTMIAGHFLGDGAIAAIGATSVLYSLLMNLAWGLNNGYCIILSRIFGGGDKAGFRSAAAAVLVPSVGYLGVAVTEPVIWCICAAFLAVFYVTVGHQRERKPSCRKNAVCEA